MNNLTQELQQSRIAVVLIYLYSNILPTFVKMNNCPVNIFKL